MRNPVAKNLKKFNKAVVMIDRKKETRKKGDYLDDYLTYEEIVKKSKKKC